jgi:hypothetical protein
MREGVLRQWFERELITPFGTRAIVFRGIKETAGIPNHVVDMLESSYLLTTEIRRGVSWYQLAHERLVEPVLLSNRRWLAEHAGTVESAHSEWPGEAAPLGRSEEVLDVVRRLRRQLAVAWTALILSVMALGGAIAWLLQR